jgi:hypothetical protein
MHHGASGQNCNRTSVRAQTAQERHAAQGAGETTLVKYHLPHLPYYPKSTTGGRHSRNASDKKGGRAATNDLCYAVCGGGGGEHPLHLNVTPLQKGGGRNIYG